MPFAIISNRTKMHPYVAMNQCIYSSILIPCLQVVQKLRGPFGLEAFEQQRVH